MPIFYDANKLPTRDATDAINNLLADNQGSMVWLTGCPIQVKAGGIVVPSYTTLASDGRTSLTIVGTEIDRDTVMLAGDFARIIDIGIQGTAGPSSSNALTTLPGIVEARAERLRIQYGMSCIMHHADDSRFFDIFALDCCGPVAPIVIDGTGWWSNVKDDTNATDQLPDGSPVTMPWHAAYFGPNGTVAKENYFLQCDFSGPWQRGSFGVYDTNAPVSVIEFNGSVLQGGSVVNARAVEIVGGSRSGSFNDPTGVLKFTGGKEF